MAKNYLLPKSGKTATRHDYSTGMSEIAVSGTGRAVIRRSGPSTSWKVYQRGELVVQSLTLQTALNALDRCEAGQ